MVAAMPRANVSKKRKSKHFAAEPIKFGSFQEGEVLYCGNKATEEKEVRAEGQRKHAYTLRGVQKENRTAPMHKMWSR